MKTGWNKAKNVFVEALKLAPAARPAFLDKACAADPVTRREVESLLASYENATSFMENSPVGDLADFNHENHQQLNAGACFAHYEIIGRIGAGGMGEVYLAKDKKLAREVAVKILNKKFARHASNLERFTREAKAASGLNHPNILVIHEIGEIEDIHFIVSEYVAGQTLREILNEKPPELKEFINISVQIAKALCAAHQAGIIHRDVKPENIIVRADGLVKILDFGLAKLIEPKNGAPAGLADKARQNNETAKGVILGTVQYMSPEQAKGEPIDERTDIFSFGVVLYEMLTGRTPFAADSASETFANLINQEPRPLSDFAANVSDELQKIVSKTLCKDKAGRYRTINGLLDDLMELHESLKYEERSKKPFISADKNKSGSYSAITTDETQKRTVSVASNTASDPQRRRRFIPAFLSALLICSALAYGFYRYWDAGNRAQPFRQIVLNRLTNSGNVKMAALSPDGNLLAYVTEEKEGVTLSVRQVGMSNSVNLVPSKKGKYFFVTFSPDGKQVYYSLFSGEKADAELYSVPALGGASRKIPIITPEWMSFAPDGNRFAHVMADTAARETVLLVTGFDGGEGKRIAARYRPQSFAALGKSCAWSPDGQTIAVIGHNKNEEGDFSFLLGVSPADGSERLLSAKRWNYLHSVQWLKNGSGLLVTGSDAPHAPRQIWFISATNGEARKLTNDLNDYSQIDAAANGTQFVAVQDLRTSSIWLGEVRQKSDDFQELHSETGTLDTVVLTAEGKIVFRSNTGGKSELWIMGADGSGRRQLTVDADVDYRGLCAAPDGRQVIFPSGKGGKVNLWRVNVEDGEPVRLTAGDGEYFPVCTPDGESVIYQKGFGYGIQSTLWKIPLDGGAPVQLADYFAMRPALSPDGRRLAFFYMTEDKWRIGVISPDGGQIGQSFDVPDGVFDRVARWSSDGQSLFYIDNVSKIGNVWRLRLDGQPPKQVTNFNSALLSDFVPAQDGKTLIVTRTATLSDVVSISEQ